MGSTRRLTRRQLKQKDQVLTGMERAAIYLQSHSRQVILVTVGVFAGILIALGGYALLSRRVRAANEGLGEAVTLFQSPVGNGATGAGRRFGSSSEKYNAALAKAAQTAEQYGRTGAGRAARLVEGSSLVHLGRLDEAGKVYTSLKEDVPSDSIAALAALGAAEVLYSKGDKAGAVAAYRELSDIDSVYLPKDNVLLRLATILEQDGDTAGALEAYERLVDETPQSLHVGTARTKLDELGAETEATAPQEASPEVGTGP